MLAGGLVPHAEKDTLQRVDLFAFDPAVHVVPCAHGLRTFNVIVGYVHTTGISRMPVDDDDLAVVAVEYVVDKRKPNGVELMDLDASVAYALELPATQGLVVGIIAESVEQGSYFHTFFCLRFEKIKEEVGNGVVAEVEIFKMDAAASLPDGFEEVVELLLSVGKQRHGIVVRERDALSAKLVDDKRVGCLRIRECKAAQQEYEGREIAFQCLWFIACKSNGLLHPGGDWLRLRPALYGSCVRA